MKPPPPMDRCEQRMFGAAQDARRGPAVIVVIRSSDADGRCPRGCGGVRWCGAVRVRKRPDLRQRRQRRGRELRVGGEQQLDQRLVQHNEQQQQRRDQQQQRDGPGRALQQLRGEGLHAGRDVQVAPRRVPGRHDLRRLALLHQRLPRQRPHCPVLRRMRQRRGERGEPVQADLRLHLRRICLQDRVLLRVPVTGRRTCGQMREPAEPWPASSSSMMTPPFA